MDDKELEEAINLELSYIELTASECEDFENTDEEENTYSSDDEVQASDEIPQSMLSYLEAFKNRTSVLEKLVLEDLEDMDSNQPYLKSINSTFSEDFKLLASDLNEDPEKLKERVLSDLEKEEDSLISTSTASAPGADVLDSIPLKNEGAVEEDTYLDFEKQLEFELKALKDKQKEDDERRLIAYEVEREKDLIEQRETEEKKRCRQRDFEEELRRMEEADKLIFKDTQIREKETSEKLQQEMVQQQELIRKLQIQMEEERRELERAQLEESMRKQKDRCCAALKIQAALRGLLARRWTRAEIQRKRDEQRRCQEQQRKKREIEERRRREKEEEKRSKEQEVRDRETRRVEYERAKEEERVRLARERKLEEEEIKEEEKRRKKEEEEGKKKEEEEERRMIEEEERKKKEEMRKDKRKSEEEEEMRKKERKNKEKEDRRKPEKVEMEEIRKREAEDERKKTEEDKKRIELEKEIREEEEERANSHLEGKEQVVRKTRIKEENPQINTEDERVKREEEEKTGEEERKCVEPKSDAKSERESGSETMEQLVEEDPKNQRGTPERLAESIKSSCYPASLHTVASIPNPTPAQSLNRRATQTTNTDADRQPFHNALQKDILLLTSIPEPLNKEDPGVLFSPPPNTTSRPESGPMMSLPDQTEEKRLTWMRDCTPWSKLSMENRRKKAHGTQGRRGQRRGAESSRPLCPDRVLQSGAWNSLQEVNTVTLEDLPGCSVSTLAQCPRLQALTLRRCGLRALEGLAVCGELRYIDVQENEITFVDCENLSNLQVLRLGQNRLTSIHGLGAAVNLAVLELSHNYITRIGGLEGLKKLQTLLVDHNQCISTRGLREVCTLLHLDCSHNHLTTVEGLEDCALLRSLDLRGNNLTEPPSLRNQVLLSELCLEDNNICSLEGLADCWLPLLQVLTGARNSITELPCLSACVSLEKLDLGHNCLSEVQNVLASLVGCAVLQEVDLTGNPLQQDSIWSSSLLKAVPSLRAVDGRPAHTGSPAPPAVPERVLPAGSFLGLCQAQLQQLRALQQRHRAELNGAPSSLAAVGVSGRHHGEALGLAKEHRYAHEYGDATVTVGHATLEPTRPPGSVQEQGPDVDPAGTVESRAVPSPRPPGSQGEGSMLATIQRKGTLVEELTRIQGMEPSDGVVSAGRVSAGNSMPSSPEEKELRDSAREPPSLNRESLHIKKMASVGIQQHWQRQRGRMDMCTPQVDGGEGGGGGRGTTAMGPSHIKTSALHPSNAATAIQALWRGYVLRRRLAAALATAASASSSEEEEDSLEEVDVDEFVFDETDLDKEWMALLSEDSSLPKSVSFSDLPLRPKSAAFLSGPIQPEFPAPLQCRPKQAWMAGQRAEPPSHGPSPESTSRTKSPTSASVIGGFSERSEKILQEWGLSDSHTALLMLKRAQKMKSTKQRQRKLLDPTVRLALFRTHANQHPPLCPPRKSLPERREYIKAHDAELGPGEPGKAEQTWPNKERTSQWLHTQAVHSDRPSESDRFLPEIDPDILNGGRVQLVAVAGYREGADQASGSQTSGTSTSPPLKELWQSRRNSMGHPKKEVPSAKRVTSAPSKKERISFRDNPVHMSGGWGGGKRREKVCK